MGRILLLIVAVVMAVTYFVVTDETSSAGYYGGPGFALSSTPTPKPRPAVQMVPMVLVFGNEYQSASGCHDTGREVAIAVPHFDTLNTSITDPVWHIPGITFRATTAVGDSGIRNVSLSADGVLRYQIFAGGGGTTQHIPFVGDICVGASGGSFGTETSVHFLQTVQR